MNYASGFESEMKKQKSASKKVMADGALLQAAALPFRRAGELEVLLVSSLDTGRWIVPKGWPMKGKTAFETAQREAFEEAGVKGEIAPQPTGRFHYDKRRRNGAVWRCMVEVFPLEVKSQSRSWPEKSVRKTRWCAWSEAAELVDDAGLGDIIRAFGAEKGGAKTAA
jgi:8-oxo-dGTP pyrophosphatase MutT (NUDIX family)